MNPTIFTGWIAAILLFFNFATCLAMPWANRMFRDCVEGEKDHCHAIGMCKYHRPVVFLSILAMMVHIVLSLTHRLG